tara:strand:+ start:1134 stop:2222 length:1089 start_codon:yes stop_codon:yes gene_type:complete
MNGPQSIDPSPRDKKLVMLVSKYLDQQLNDDEIKQLEARLQSDPVAMRYCAEQICLHARLHTRSTPLHINAHESRDLIIGQEDGRSTLTTRTTNQMTIGSKPHITIKEIAGSKTKQPLFVWSIVAFLLIILMIAIYWWPQKHEAQNSWALLPLENASFEVGEAKDGQRTRNIPGWRSLSTANSAVILNPTNINQALPHGHANLIKSYSQVDGQNVMVLSRTSIGALGWVKQKLYSQTEQGGKIVQRLGDLKGNVIQVKMLVGRPRKEAGVWNNPVNLRVSIQEEAPPYRSAADYRIDTGSSKWKVADVDLALGYDQFKEISFALNINPKEIEGDAYLVIEVDRSTAKGAEVYIDKIELRVIK